MNAGPSIDLLVILPGDNERAVFSEMLNRSEALGIRPIGFELRKHFHRDPGIRLEGAEFSRLFRATHRHVVLAFDYDGCGAEEQPPGEIVTAVQHRLDDVTWQSCSHVTLIVPELEIWLWQTPYHIDQVLELRADAREEMLFQWQRQNVPALSLDEAICQHPKEALQYLFRQAHKPRSSRLYGQMARRASLRAWRRVESFHHLTDALQRWFPPTGTSDDR